MVYALKLILLVFAILFGLYAIFAASKGFYSLLRASACKRLAEQAKKLLWENNIVGAVAMFLKAEKKWSINSHDGGRESLIADIDLYGSICRGLFKALHINSGSLYRDVFGILNEMKTLIKDRSNFAVDGRNMKPEALARWKGLLGRLQSLRKPIHDTCKPKMLLLR
jgi:hypothetical protein